MSKIKIKTKLINKENNIKKELKGILKDNEITFFDDGVKVKIYKNDSKIKIIRSTDEYQIIMNFEKFLTIEGKYDIKNIGILELKTKTKELKIEKNRVYIEYTLYINNENMGFNIYELEYEVMV